MCGVFGIHARDRDVARLTYFGLHALQHRGQESAGIAVSDDGRLTALRDLGLVTQVFDERNLSGLVGLAEGRLFAFRDAHGFRPLALGRLGDDPVVASETCALDLVGARFERDLLPGELLIAGEDGELAVQALAPREHGALCIFEFFYLARPDTRLAGVEVHGARVRMGERLAEESPVEADLVLPIPDSGTPAAIGFARATGIPFSEGLIKNRYVGRTFIQPEQGMREQGIRMKFNPLDEVAGKRLVIVDDSIVRGSTTRQIVQMLFDAGAAEVHVRISSPPVVGPCFYGIDLAGEDELIAAGATTDEVRAAIGATSLSYLSLDGLQAATHRPASALCRACLTREYPTWVPEGRVLRKLRFEPAHA
ncbi:MAG: amidophosphoribosyltransferase [Actinobacteria bacterium]|nr:amidophosphoribosyltransferase [Actinomycetota bacterium]